MTRYRRILHASDFSPASRRAFDEALRLAKANDAELMLVHIVEAVHPVVQDYMAAAQVNERQLVTSYRSAAGKRIDALSRKARAAGVRVKARLVEGDPREVIAAAAKRTRADLVVVGTHGRTGLKKLVLGSVAARVVATSPCPVLTVRGG
jgi:nucleotide-binding universal stress UspA family protein